MFDWTAPIILYRARAASRARDWSLAAKRYKALLRKWPDRAAIWVQLGHALKELGDLDGAKASYDRAINLAPRVADGWLHLGHIQKLRLAPAAATEAFAIAASLAPALQEPVDELIALRAGHRLIAARGRGVAEFGPVEDCGDLEGGLLAQLDETRRPEFVPIDQYDVFRRQLLIARPPRATVAPPLISVLIDARRATPADLRTTLSSLLDQGLEDWSATVLAPAALRDHSVASLQHLDRRVRFVDPLDGAGDGFGWTLILNAGVVLHQNAIAWFGFVAQRTHCVAAYCDHDHSVDDLRYGRRFQAPILQPMYDPDWFEAVEAAPAALLIDRSRYSGPLDGADPVAQGARLAQAAEMGGVAHIPVLLATAKAADLDLEPTVDFPSQPRRTRAANGVIERIQVIIQTRDEAQLLRACVESLRKKAERPDQLDITIVDNRSTERETQRLLAQLRSFGVEILRLDEPFNWSRANNLAVESGRAPLVLFLNNDTEMITTGWDGALRDLLARPDVGVVGALLHYPDQTIQHAGMVFGTGAHGPVHEGVGRADGEPGPVGRWLRLRSAAAVTGAFMALRRSTFEAVGCFDAIAFAIAVNDVDLCLKVRAQGLRVLQAPQIRLTHHESKTRGGEFTPSRIAWDLQDLALLYRRWGRALFEDPGYNPHWARYGRPFEGYRFPSLREIVRRIDLSAHPQPWRVSPGEEGVDPEWWW